MKTPQQSYPELAKALGTKAKVFLKREDLHTYGSHKGRSIPLMIKRYTKEGIRDFVISSSGNAALAAIHAAEQHNKNNPDNQISLKVFVGKKIPKHKLDSLYSIYDIQNSSIQIEQIERPKQAAFQLDKSGKAKYLRQSTDDLALEGYFELAKELNNIPNLEAIFIPTSSGTTAEAIWKGFRSLSQKPQIHIVQTSACHPIVAELGAREDNENIKISIAGAIVDNIAHRKKAVAAVVKQSSGSAWVPSEEEIANAVILVKRTTNLDISPNSALSVAGLKKAIDTGIHFDGAVACLVTGT